MTPDEKAILDALSARLVPTDEHGPGAREANVLRYLQRALDGAYSGHRESYASGLAALDRHARVTYGHRFCKLAPDAQDDLLAEVERGAVPGFPQGSAAFFEMVRTHVLEGMFGDPRWGGNSGFAGWDLLGYPGLRRVWTEAEQRLDAVVPRAHRGRDDLHGERS